MRISRRGIDTCLLGSTLLFSTPILADATEAHQVFQHSAVAIGHQSDYFVPSAGYHATLGHGLFAQSMSPAGHRARQGATQSWGISCVPYARQVSGIMVVGNAWQWWDKAAGQYARGDQPEPGSILNFRANGRMRLGHVAVVTRLVNAREIIVDQANWPSHAMRGGISHNVAVVDVSEANNWSAVRVELPQGGEFGSVYPTYGFIYNRPDTVAVSTRVTRPAPLPHINPVPSDLRPAAERPWNAIEEIADTSANTPRRINLRAAQPADASGG